MLVSKIAYKLRSYRRKPTCTKSKKHGEELNRKPTITETQQHLLEMRQITPDGWNAALTGISHLQAHSMYVSSWLWSISGAADASLCQRFLRLQLYQPGLLWKTAALLRCWPHNPPQKSPFWAQKPPSVGNAGLRVSCDRHFNLSSLCAKINVSRKLDKSLTVSNSRNVPYFLFHYEKGFYLDFSEIQCDCSFN